jgi:hypothetical protein
VSTGWWRDRISVQGPDASADTRASGWITQLGQPFDYTVASIIPSCFSRCVRVFHPAWRVVPPSQQRVEVHWSEVATRNERLMHPAAEWGSLTGSWKLESQPGLWDAPPTIGSLPVVVAQRLLTTLMQHTTTPEQCWFGIWNGYDGLPQSLVESGAHFRLSEREMLLLSGVGPAVLTSPLGPSDTQLANLWWPQDRSWCVGTDIDLMTTFVAGDSTCITSLLAQPKLEVLEVTFEQRIAWDADTLNPLPDAPDS